MAKQAMTTSHSINPESKHLIGAIKEEKQIVYAYREMSENASYLKKELAAINGIIGDDDSSNTGKTLIKAGTCLIAFPEPVVSGIVGTTLVVAGFALNKLGETNNARTLYKEHQKSLQDIQRLQREICQTIF
ncbi:MAG: hypothetical protein QG670_1826 [Thermoproteota archaeon]|nr:hypothetical protein [Thermoproteota archaeon]